MFKLLVIFSKTYSMKTILLNEGNIAEYYKHLCVSFTAGRKNFSGQETHFVLSKQNCHVIYITNIDLVT